MNLAPIIVFAYDRQDHLSKTLAALAKNDLAPQSVLYIYSDGPRDWSGAASSFPSRVKSSARSDFQWTPVEHQGVGSYITKGYGDTLNECYGVYNNVDEIDFAALPNQFVMKMTNASGRNWICKDKSRCDWHAKKQQFEEWLQDYEFGWQTGEWQYALIKPRIISEKYLTSLGELAPIDYKFQCFHGEPNSCFVGYDRDPNVTHGKVCFDDYDMNWNITDNILPWRHRKRRLLPKPQYWDRMVQMARDVSKDFPYLRFDVYEIDGKILFGEMTFTPQGCVQEFYTQDALEKMLIAYNK